MKGLYDIHCHILPGVDDGSRNMEESLWMLNKEYNEGVRHVILTPHFRYDMFEPHMNIVTRQFMQLRRAAMNIGEDGMRLYLGCELHSSMDMVECLKKGRRLTLGTARINHQPIWALIWPETALLMMKSVRKLPVRKSSADITSP